MWVLGSALLLCYLSLPCEARSWKQRTACNVAPASPQDRRSDKSVLRVGTLNAEWLFLNNWSKRWSTYGEAVEHLNLIAGVIRKLNYDVLNLVEVESCEVLHELFLAVGDPTYKSFLLPGTDTSTGQNVALFTRVDPTEDLWRTTDRVAFPVPQSTCGYSGSGDYGVSKHYFTRIQAENFGTILLASVHFLAFPDRPDRCSQREAQASVIRNVLKQQRKAGEEVIIFGDFNDYDGQILDVKGSTPISRVLQFLKDFDVQTEGQEAENAAVKAPQDTRFTAYYSPNLCLPKNLGSSSIDHVLMTPGLLSRAVGNPFETSLYDSPCSSSQPYSDHWPLLVQLKAA